jgi:hypothetical protein
MSETLRFDPAFDALLAETQASTARAWAFGKAAERFLAAIRDVEDGDLWFLGDAHPAIGEPGAYLERLRAELGAMVSEAEAQRGEVEANRRSNSRVERARRHLERAHREWVWKFGAAPKASAWVDKDGEQRASPFVQVVNAVMKAAGLPAFSYKTIHAFIADPDNELELDPD